MSSHFDVDDFILNFDPAAPQARFRGGRLGAELVTAEAALPKPVPWPNGLAPTPAPLSSPPPETSDLSRFHGYDAIVVTWTAAEASALASLFTPGFPTSAWYEYRHGIDAYIPLVTGVKAPFNDSSAEMKRYYHSLGLYFPCKIGEARVLLFKSGLHLDYDGPATPVFKLMGELAETVAPKVFITTGTGGGIGTDVKLGDVVIAGTVRFDCKTQFAGESWAGASFVPSKLPPGALEALTPALTGVNATRIPGARPHPRYFSAANDTIVTTDFFAFDDSSNHFGLQGLGQACDMGDAMVARALQTFPHIQWYAIRNASDPQISNPSDDIKTAGEEAAKIYGRYGGLTTAASVIAAWSIIQTSVDFLKVNEGGAIRPGFKLGRKKDA
jgi:Phosphorylase superfamily